MWHPKFPTTQSHHYFPFTNSQTLNSSKSSDLYSVTKKVFLWLLSFDFFPPNDLLVGFYQYQYQSSSILHTFPVRDSIPAPPPEWGTVRPRRSTTQRTVHGVTVERAGARAPIWTRKSRTCSTRTHIRIACE